MTGPVRVSGIMIKIVKSDRKYHQILFNRNTPSCYLFLTILNDDAIIYGVYVDYLLIFMAYYNYFRGYTQICLL